MAGSNERETLGQWFRKGEVFDKLVLLAWIATLIVIILHVTHDKVDDTVVQWFENLANTVSGTLIGIITGRRMAAADAGDKPVQSQTINAPAAQSVGTVVQTDAKPEA